jgi:hypothetical protein
MFEEIMVDNLPSIKKNISLKIQVTEQAPNKKKLKQCVPRLIIIKLLKTRNRSEKNDITYREQMIQMTADFSLKTMQARKKVAQFIFSRL